MIFTPISSSWPHYDHNMCGSNISEVALQKIHQHNWTSASAQWISKTTFWHKQSFRFNRMVDAQHGTSGESLVKFRQKWRNYFCFVHSVSCDSQAIIISLQWIDCIRELQHGDNNIHLLMWEMMNTNGALSVYMRLFLWKVIFQIAYSRHCLVRMKHHPFSLSKQLILNILHINENLQM